MTIVKRLLFILTLGLTLSCSDKGSKIEAGSVCTIEDGEGKFGVVKVLVIDDDMAHVKIYKNKFDIRPATIDIKTLTLGTMPGTTGIPSDGFGIGHVPLSRQVFESWKPIFVGFENVSEEELEGYKMWQADLHN
jgi:hypothetical protein